MKQILYLRHVENIVKNIICIILHELKNLHSIESKIQIQRATNRNNKTVGNVLKDHGYRQQKVDPDMVALRLQIENCSIYFKLLVGRYVSDYHNCCTNVSSFRSMGHMFRVHFNELGAAADRS